ncbi:MAG: hypothetical protein FJ272_02430 [Planctomycetes bacterium]|nr:hypothetical protein [Planctomycetota bacterium]
MDCHSPERARRLARSPLELPDELKSRDRRQLDEAVFELLGVSSAETRRKLVDRLYEETVRHYRQIRIVEIQKMEQRSKAKARRFAPDELAADIWDVVRPEWKVSLSHWLRAQPGDKATVDIPEPSAKLAPSSHLFDACTVYFGKGRKLHQEFPHRPLAELVAELANAGVTGAVEAPKGQAECVQALQRLRERLSKSGQEFEQLADSRTGTERLCQEIVAILKRWSIAGR